MSSLGPNENPLASDLAHILAHTRELWETIRGENIFVTGGTGFFGRWLLESFHHANEQLKLEAHLVVLSRNPEKFQKEAPHLARGDSIRFVRGDVRSFTLEQLREELPNFDPTFRFLIHAATDASAKLSAENPLLMFDTITQGTRAALEFAAAAGTRRFLFISSGAVYGKQPNELTHVPEDYLGAPDCCDVTSAYGEGKRAAETLAVCFGKRHDIDVLIARCFAFVGPFLPLDTHFAIGNFIRDALAGRTISVDGDGTPYRSYLYAADLAIWLWTILFRGQAFRSYNVGSEADAPIAQIASAVAQAAHAESKIAVRGTPVKGVPPSRYVPSTQRAREELGLQEGGSLAEAITKTLRYYSAD